MHHAIDLTARRRREATAVVSDRNHCHERKVGRSSKKFGYHVLVSQESSGEDRAQAVSPQRKLEAPDGWQQRTVKVGTGKAAGIVREPRVKACEHKHWNFGKVI
jgi:hypothetical protein